MSSFFTKTHLTAEQPLTEKKQTLEPSKMTPYIQR